MCNTRDFALSRPDYAPKYWAKFQPVLDALESRGVELYEVMGKDVYERVRTSIWNMQGKVAALKPDNAFIVFA